MKVEKLLEDKLKREYSVTIPANDIDMKVNAKLASLSKKVNIPGFRKGKVPLDIVKKKYKDEVMGEVIQELVDSSAQETIDNNNLKPAQQPQVQITSYDEGKDLTYKITLEVMPQVPEVKFDKISIKKQVAEISDADVTKIINEVANNYKNFKPIEGARSAKKGDAVKIDFEGFTGGVAFPGGKGEGHQLELGSNSFIPGFEDQLIGSKKGDETSVKVTFPKEYHSADLAGKEAEFKIKVHDILEKGDTEINDEFAAKLGQKDLSALKETIKQNLSQDANDMSRVLMKKELFDALEKAIDFELPERMVETELKSILQQVKASNDYEDGEHSHDHGAEGHVHDENCAHGHDHDHGKPAKKDKKESKEDKKLRDEYLPLAKRRVMLGILVTDIAQKNKVQVTNEELNRALLNEASRYPGQEKEVVEFYRKNPQALQNLTGPILEEKVVDSILSQVKVSEQKSGLEDLRQLVLENNK